MKGGYNDTLYFWIHPQMPEEKNKIMIPKTLKKSIEVCLYGNFYIPLLYKLKAMNERTIKIVLSDDAKNFIKIQPLKAQQKIVYNIKKVEGGVMDKELFKKLDDTDIWELRTLFNGICYRLLSFWDNDEGALVIVTHGIIKKTQKTPSKEIAKAEAIRTEYFNDKKEQIWQK